MAADRTETLIDLRDDLATTRNLAAALYMAACNPSVDASNRSALAELSNLVCERLESTVARLDTVISKRP